MKEIFQFIFLVRNLKREKVKVTLKDIWLINSFYRAFKLRRWISFKEYYIMVINHSVETIVNFETSSRDVAYIIFEEKMMIMENGK